MTKGTFSLWSFRNTCRPEPFPAITNTAFSGRSSGFTAPPGTENSTDPPAASNFPAVIPNSSSTYPGVKTCSGVPHRSMRPSFMHTTRSEILSARSSSWRDMITESSFFLAISRSRDRNSSLYFTSR